tara:strand:- start:721 stop:1164 length:444 start_codon:yes stop_codon:yes gene_type:complete
MKEVKKMKNKLELSDLKLRGIDWVSDNQTYDLLICNDCVEYNVDLLPDSTDLDGNRKEYQHTKNCDWGRVIKTYNGITQDTCFICDSLFSDKGNIHYSFSIKISLRSVKKYSLIQREKDRHNAKTAQELDQWRTKYFVNGQTENTLS